MKPEEGFLSARQAVAPTSAGPLITKSGKRLCGRTTDKPCERCGQIFRVQIAKLKRGEGRFCSRNCSADPSNFGTKSHKWTKDEAAVISRLGGMASGGHNRIEVPYRHRHPDRRRAHSAVLRALRKGALVKSPCVDCGTSDRLHAHHEDYTKPLEVIWLCTFCHRARHIAQQQERAS
jgi:hypothetical protein